MPYSKRLIFLCLAGFLPLISLAQSYGNYPSSMNGAGRADYFGNTQQLGMGGTGMGLRAEQSINLLNPASLSDNNNTLLEAGFTGFTVWNKLPGAVASNRTLGGDLGYVALSLPLWRKIGWSTAVAALPYTRMSFDFSSSSNNVMPMEIRSRGYGGLSKVYNAHSFRLFKGFNIAAGGSFIYGQLIQDQRTYFPDSLNTYNFWSRNSYYVNGFSLDGSFQYQFKVGLKKPDVPRPHTVTIGAKYEYALPLNSRLESERYTFSRVITNAGASNEVSYDVVNDTLVYQDLPSRKIKLGNTLSAGLGFQYKTKWWLGADFQYRDLAGADLPFGSWTQSAWTARLGFQWLGSPESNKNYFDKVQWRLGGSYGLQPYMGSTTQATQWTASVGAGFPLEKNWRKSPRNWLNISVEYGQIAWDGYSNENQVRLTLGITLQDKWFNKMKIE